MQPIGRRDIAVVVATVVVVKTDTFDHGGTVRWWVLEQNSK